MIPSMLYESLKNNVTVINIEREGSITNNRLTFLAGLIFEHKFLNQDSNNQNFYQSKKENFSFYLPSALVNEIDKLVKETSNNHKISRSDIVFISVREFFKVLKKKVVP